MVGILKGLVTTFKTHFRRPVTVQYPNDHLPLAPRYMGFPGLPYDYKTDEPVCVGCQVCERYCPTECITVTMMDNPKYKEGTSTRKKIVERFELDINHCMVCGICVEVCAFDAIEMTHCHDIAAYTQKSLIADTEMLIKIWERYKAPREETVASKDGDGEDEE